MLSGVTHFLRKSQMRLEWPDACLSRSSSTTFIRSSPSIEVLIVQRMYLTSIAELNIHSRTQCPKTCLMSIELVVVQKTFLASIAELSIQRHANIHKVTNHPKDILSIYSETHRPKDITRIGIPGEVEHTCLMMAFFDACHIDMWYVLKNGNYIPTNKEGAEILRSLWNEE
ncbi:hypothetical protein CR513_26248, partial [Mucuna pruriens]